MDFAALPPEVNSGRMYAGAGAGPMVAAAAAWDSVASELNSAASSYRASILELTGGPWLGPSAASMAAAAAPYLAWMNTTATQAEQTANQARSAVAAYESAFIATVPPPVIAANRALLLSLVATNILGQNTPAIAATESHYAQMWAQDAAAMYSYAGSSAAATQLTPFSAAPQTTNPGGAGAQAAAASQATSTASGSSASQLLSTVPNALQTMASGASTGGPGQWLLNLLNSTPVQAFEGLMEYTSGYQEQIGAWGFMASGVFFLMNPALNLGPTSAMALMTAPGAAAAGLPEGALGAAGLPEGALGAALGGAGVSAGVGEAASVGGLTVPQSWATAAPEVQLAAKALPMAGLSGLPQAGAAGPGGWFGGIPPIGSVVNAPRNGEPSPRSYDRRAAMRQAAGESGPHEGTLGRCASAGRANLSERDELERLRQSIADVAKERDLLKRSAALLIKEALQKGNQ